MPDRREIKLIAEALDSGFDPEDENTPIGSIPGFDDQEGSSEVDSADEIPSDDMMGDAANEGTITIDRDLLHALLCMMKERGCKGETELESPESPESPDESETGGDEGDDPIMGEGKDGPPFDDEDDGDEDGDAEEDDADAEAEEDVEGVEEASDSIDTSDCQQLVDKLIELNTGGGPLTLDIMPQIAELFGDDAMDAAEAASDCDGPEQCGDGPPAEDGPPADIDGPPSDDSDFDDEITDKDVAEARMLNVEEINEDFYDDMPQQHSSVADIANPDPMGPDTGNYEPENCDEQIYARFGPPGTVLDDAQAQEALAMCRDFGIDEFDAPLVHTINGWIVENVDNKLVRSISEFAQSVLGEKVMVKETKSKDGAEFLGTEESFIKITKAINESLAVLKEGKKSQMGSMTKYSKCYPIRGNSRLFFAFK